jgi:hypothetical protein
MTDKPPAETLPGAPDPAKPGIQPLDHLRATDLRAIAQLATQATMGVAAIAEGVHQAVLDTIGLTGTRSGKTRGITGLVYRAVHGVTELVGKGLEAAFTQLEPLLESLVDEPPETPAREAVLAALNGVMGDRLAEAKNPLATSMTVRHKGLALPLDGPVPIAKATGKVLLLIHGLCMNDLQWQAPPHDPAHDPKGTDKKTDTADEDTPSDHAAALSEQLGYTPVYLRYNTGLHTSQNGHELVKVLEQLVAHWPVPVKDLSVVVHSMGGLVIRSAVYYARLGALHWPDAVKNIVFLGTPHHGAPLERAGNWVDTLLGSTSYSKPFAKLGQLRSTGITDLRWGNVLDADWQKRDRFERSPDLRQPLQLPHGIACFTVAATAAAQRSPLADQLIGDGLVPLPSALGQHDDSRRNLFFPESAQMVLYNAHHMELLDRPEVTRQLLAWLGPAKAR